jgi:hypothetical protein
MARTRKAKPANQRKYFKKVLTGLHRGIKFSIKWASASN